MLASTRANHGSKKKRFAVVIDEHRRGDEVPKVALKTSLPRFCSKFHDFYSEE